jgi:hypothetical protein
LFVKQLGGEFQALDSFHQRFLVRDFLRHPSFILRRSAKINH